MTIVVTNMVMIATTAMAMAMVQYAHTNPNSTIDANAPIMITW